MLKLTNFLILYTCLAACGGLYYSNYDFDLRAVYRVAKSDLVASVRAEGFVDEGQDVADKPSTINGTVVIAGKDSIELRLFGDRLLLLMVNDVEKPFLDSTDLAGCLLASLRQLDIRPIDSLEVVALSDAILSTGAGPKGAIFNGQRDLVLVDTVYYTTADR
jgi:hypothetical protein